MIDQDKVRNSLLAKQTELQKRIGATQDTERRDVKEGDIDNAHLWEESDIRDDLDNQATAELDHVNQALARLEAGEYGICTECGEPIGEARLKALPYATLCIEDAKEAEQTVSDQ